jgi:hypothetical protein
MTFGWFSQGHSTLAIFLTNIDNEKGLIRYFLGCISPVHN